MSVHGKIGNLQKMDTSFGAEAKADDITISVAVYNELLKNQKFLYALISAGVDNWDGYEHAQEAMED